MDGVTTTFDGACNGLRHAIKEYAKHTKVLVESTKSNKYSEKSDQGEMIANLMLAYRHLEDCSMRLGKAIQAYDGGVSVYDKNVVGSPE